MRCCTVHSSLAFEFTDPKKCSLCSSVCYVTHRIGFALALPMSVPAVFVASWVMSVASVCILVLCCSTLSSALAFSLSWCHFGFFFAALVWLLWLPKLLLPLHWFACSLSLRVSLLRLKLPSWTSLSTHLATPHAGENSMIVVYVLPSEKNTPLLHHYLVLVVPGLKSMFYFTPHHVHQGTYLDSTRLSVSFAAIRNLSKRFSSSSSSSPLGHQSW